MKYCVVRTVKRSKLKLASVLTDKACTNPVKSISMNQFRVSLRNLANLMTNYLFLQNKMCAFMHGKQAPAPFSDSLHRKMTV